MKKLYVAVEELYGRVTEQLPQVEGNPCGDCRSCCHAANMISHSVSRLELAYLGENIGQDRADLFRRFLDREKDGEGHLVFPACPLLNERGCSAHIYRPLSCRLYGHYRSDETKLIDHCVFRGKEIAVPAKDQKKLMPGTQEMTLLALDYASYFPPELKEKERADWTPQTDLEKAADFMKVGDYAAATPILEGLLTQEDSALLNEMLAGCYQGVGLFPQAAERFSRALVHQPENPQLHYRLGAAHFLAQNFDRARTSLGRSLELVPDNPTAQGLLGFVHRLQNRHEEAAPLLEAAVKAETQPGPYRLQLAFAQHNLGQLEEARKSYTMALEFAPTQADAQAGLDSLSEM